MGLRGRIESGEGPQSIQVALAELDTALEELRAAEEELAAQQSTIAASRFELDQERQRYKSLFDFAPDPYIVTDQNGVIREANIAAAQTLMVEPALLVGKPFVNFVPDAERGAFRGRLAGLLESGAVTRWEMSLVPRVGKREVPFRVTGHAVGSGPSTAIRWILSDLTELRKLTTTVRALDESMWDRVAEHTAALSNKVEVLEAQIERLRDQAGGKASQDGNGEAS